MTFGRLHRNMMDDIARNNVYTSILSIIIAVICFFILANTANAENVEPSTSEIITEVSRILDLNPEIKARTNHWVNPGEKVNLGHGMVVTVEKWRTSKSTLWWIAKAHLLGKFDPKPEKPQVRMQPAKYKNTLQERPEPFEGYDKTPLYIWLLILFLIKFVDWLYRIQASQQITSFFTQTGQVAAYACTWFWVWVDDYVNRGWIQSNKSTICFHWAHNRTQLWNRLLKHSAKAIPPKAKRMWLRTKNGRGSGHFGPQWGFGRAPPFFRNKAYNFCNCTPFSFV